MSLYTDLIEAGIPVNNHYSDLYFAVTPETHAILRKHPLQCQNATVFASQIDGQRTYDVPFAFVPYWERKTKGST